MSFEFKKEDSMIRVVCTSHGDQTVLAEVLVREVKFMIPREKKRPMVEKRKLLTVRCQLCKTFEEYEFKTL